MEQRWRAVCIEKCKHGSERGLHKPTLEIRQGGAFLLYYIGNGKMVHAPNSRSVVRIDDIFNSSYWTKVTYNYRRLY